MVSSPSVASFDPIRSESESGEVWGVLRVLGRAASCGGRSDVGGFFRAPSVAFPVFGVFESGVGSDEDFGVESEDDSFWIMPPPACRDVAAAPHQDRSFGRRSDCRTVVRRGRAIGGFSRSDRDSPFG
ncbi:MAG: hypothetical protein CMJ51_04365 [Planctomycetaceae bacterium]|nr:hypothetical protein [Planctomycetaceae bacterium]